VIDRHVKVTGYTTSQIQCMVSCRAEARLRYLSFNEMKGVVMNLPKILTDQEKIEKRNSRIEKLMGLFSYYNLMESTGQVSLMAMERTFEFDEIIHDEQLRAFTGSSSFVGNVRYNQDEQSMRILLNGIAYQFCRVPERIFDAFEGANSKGAFFNRNIKGQFDC